MKNLTEKELDAIQGLVNEFNALKVQLGDTVISQRALSDKVEVLKVDYAKEEKKLIKKYGKDSVINIQTGEITKAEAEVVEAEMAPVK
tara:strand:- start:73 stop:336 length:264 start_codon:yes stop_codon:yes gene_type:complete